MLCPKISEIFIVYFKYFMFQVKKLKTMFDHVVSQRVLLMNKDEDGVKPVVYSALGPRL